MFYNTFKLTYDINASYLFEIEHCISEWYTYIIFITKLSYFKASVFVKT